MKKTLFVFSLVFLLVTCDNGGMDTTDKNPLVGVWWAAFVNGAEVIGSSIQFTENHFFFYYVLHLTPQGVETSRDVYKGKYTYNESSKIIFFEIDEPSNEAGVTSSSYMFHDGKLYCYGNKITVTETLHEKQDVSQYITN